MSVAGHTVSAKGVVGLALLLLMVAGLVPAMTSPPARTITLVARDMAFYLEGDNAHPNPVIDVNASEHVTIVLRNQDRGMMHDFSVPASAVSTKLLAWNDQGEVTFRVPNTAGTYEYVCRPHLPLMKGFLRVTGQ